MVWIWYDAPCLIWLESTVGLYKEKVRDNQFPKTSEVPNKAETWHHGCFFPLPRFSIASDLCNRSSIAEIKRRSKKGRFLWIHSCEVLKHIWQSDGILFKVVGLAKFWEICKHCQNLGKGMIITGRPQTSFKAIIKHSFWCIISRFGG